MVNYQELKFGQIVYYYECQRVYWGYDPDKNCVILSDLTMGFNQSKRRLIHVSHVFEIATQYKGV